MNLRGRVDSERVQVEHRPAHFKERESESGYPADPLSFHTQIGVAVVGQCIVLVQVRARASADRRVLRT